MEHRKEALVNNHYYHIYSRSIARFVIFNDESDYARIIEIANLYKYRKFKHKYSGFKELSIVNQSVMLDELEKLNDLLVEIVAYCLMPTHVHFILKQVTNRGISIFTSKLFNSYARYFNVKHKRNGPLWAGRFKSVLVDNDKQLLHLTRYIHLNPVSANIVAKPDDWGYSSYREYLNASQSQSICNFDGLFNLSPKEYEKFVLDRKFYQQELSLIKYQLIDGYIG